MNFFLCSLLAAGFVLLGLPCSADEASEFFDMETPDADLPSNDPGRPEDLRWAAIPENIRKMLITLERFTALRRAQSQSEFAAGRKEVAAILVKTAVTADAAARARLLKEAKRIESLPFDQPLIETAASPSLRTLLGSWHCPPGKWTVTITPDGRIMFKSGPPSGNWRWVDEKRGVIAWTHSDIVQIMQINGQSSPPKAVLLNVQGIESRIEKQSDLPNQDGKGLAASDEPLTLLAAKELTNRRNTDALIRSKEEKVVGWLLKQAPKLPADQSRLLVERVTELEKRWSPSASTSAGLLRGIWTWAGKELDFTEGGVLVVNKFKAGRWEWGKLGTNAAVVFVIEAEDTAAVGYLSRSAGGLMHVRTSKGSASDAKRD